MNIDARGDACPIPVVKTRKALKDLPPDEILSVEVDNEIASQNLEKMCAETGLGCSIEKISGKHFIVTISRGADQAAARGTNRPAAQTADQTAIQAPDQLASQGSRRPPAQPADQPTTQLPNQTDGVLVIIPSSTMGEGDGKLGAALMKSFIYALAEGGAPGTMIFYNGGAMLTATDSPVLPDLLRLGSAGTKIFTCGACINFYGLNATPAVGTATNMYAIVEMMNGASKVIRP